MNPDQIAQAFCQARTHGTALLSFPGGEVPPTLEDAYLVQDAAIAAWPDQVVAWKVALIAPAWQAQYKNVRLSGPVFAKRLRLCTDAQTTNERIIDGGIAATETEFAIRVNDQFPLYTRFDSQEQLAPYIASVHAAIEVAGSPLATLGTLGPGAMISDFGNNTALLIGPELPGFFSRDPSAWRTSMYINARPVGEGHAARIPDGPLAALLFLVNNLVDRGTTLRPLQWVSTGASNGIHPVKPGDHAEAFFDDRLLLSVRLDTV
ncbi:MAG: 2-keto-4-pentenoate hydratase [Janthinobacterium lividum]